MRTALDDILPSQDHHPQHMHYGQVFPRVVLRDHTEASCLRVALRYVHTPARERQFNTFASLVKFVSGAFYSRLVRVGGVIVFQTVHMTMGYKICFVLASIFDTALCAHEEVEVVPYGPICLVIPFAKVPTDVSEVFLTRDGSGSNPAGTLSRRSRVNMEICSLPP